jgi:MFS transporter, ACS family, tartrate transporter
MTESERVFSKCERVLVPFAGLLYLVSIIDRLNVGFAALTMNTDLNLSPSVFGFGAGIFFLGYSLFQVPANFILVRLGARRWVFTILVTWGAISAACAFVQGPVSFYVLRFLLGIAEAGLFPGMVLYLTRFLPDDRRARAIAGFMAASPLAFIVIGPISSLILNMNGFAGLRGWQWLFVLEGLPACVLGFVLLKIVPETPAEAAWLNADEKKLIAEYLPPETAKDSESFFDALLNPTLYVLGIAYMAVAAGGYGMRLWLPQIVQGMGVPDTLNGFVVAIPYILAMAAMIWWGHSSDKTQERIWHVISPTLVGALGFFIAAVSASDAFMFLGITLVILGLDAVIGPFWSLPASLLRGGAAASGVALINTFGTGAGGFVGPSLIGYLKEATGTYNSSMLVLAVSLIATCIIVLALARNLSDAAMVQRKT